MPRSLSLLVLLLILLAQCSSPVYSFAAFMTDHYCATQLQEKVEIMGRAVVASNDVVIVAKKGDQTLENGSTVDSFDGIEFQTSPYVKEATLEILSAGTEFVDGFCINKNRVTRKGTVKSAGSPTELTVHSGWAKGMLDGVKLTPKFTLYLSGNKDL